MAPAQVGARIIRVKALPQWSAGGTAGATDAAGHLPVLRARRYGISKLWAGGEAEASARPKGVFGRERIRSGESTASARREQGES